MAARAQPDRAVQHAPTAPVDSARGRRRLLPLLFGSLLAAIAIERLGMLFLRPEEGTGHAARMVGREIGYLNRDFVEAELIASPATMIVGAARWVWRWGFEVTGIAGAVEWLSRKTTLGAFAVAAVITVQLFLLRCLVLLFSLPVFGVFVAVGLATGLSMRDVRRWSAGREFGGAFHVVRRWPGRCCGSAASCTCRCRLRSTRRLWCCRRRCCSASRAQRRVPCSRSTLGAT